MVLPEVFCSTTPSAVATLPEAKEPKARFGVGWPSNMTKKEPVLAAPFVLPQRGVPLF